MENINLNKLSESIVISKYIVERVGLLPSYSQLEEVSNELKLSFTEIKSFIELYKCISSQMKI